MFKEKSAGAIIFRQNKERKYLLLHYEQGHWDFVKGNIENKESEKETIIREAKEEANINKLYFIDGFREIIKYFYEKDKELINKEVIFCIAKTEQKNVKLSYEHIAYKWLNFNDSLKLLTYKTAKDILKKAEDFLKKYYSQKKLDSY